MKSPKKSAIYCNVPVDKPEDLKDNIILPPSLEYTLFIDYPLENTIKYKIKTGKSGITKNELLVKICKFYKEIYKKPIKNGVWGHTIADLFIEEVDIYHDKKEIKIFVGS